MLKLNWGKLGLWWDITDKSPGAVYVTGWDCISVAIQDRAYVLFLEQKAQSTEVACVHCGFFRKTWWH